MTEAWHHRVWHDPGAANTAGALGLALAFALLAASVMVGGPRGNNALIVLGVACGAIGFVLIWRGAQSVAGQQSTLRVLTWLWLLAVLALNLWSMGRARTLDAPTQMAYGIYHASIWLSFALIAATALWRLSSWPTRAVLLLGAALSPLAGLWEWLQWASGAAAPSQQPEETATWMALTIAAGLVLALGCALAAWPPRPRTQPAPA